MRRRLNRAHNFLVQVCCGDANPASRVYAYDKLVVCLVASMVATLILTVFMLIFGPRMVKGMLGEAVPERRERYAHVVARIRKSIGGYVNRRYLTFDE